MTSSRAARAPRRFSRVVAVAAGGVVLLLAVLVAAGLVYERIASAGAAERYPAPGVLVDAGSTSLHLQVSPGPPGAPVVVLEAGSGETSLSWRDVPAALTDVATVVSYDRAGTGWSGPATTPRTGEHIVDELHQALAAAEVDGPYVFVGHSMGGLFSRLFAERYPEEVAGLVLVDSRPEGDAARTAPILEAAGFAGNPPVWVVSALSETGVMRLFAVTVLAGSVDPEDQARFVDVVADREFFRVRQEEADLIGSTEDAVRGQRLGPLPVVVVARGLAQDYAAAGLSPEVGAEIEDIWQDGQRQLLKLSTASRLVVAEGSGHMVMRDQPDVVVESVREVVGEVTRGAGASAS